MALFAGSGCIAHYKDRTGGVRHVYQAGQADAALEQLDQAAADGNLDELLLLLDRGMLLHVAGRHAESIEALTAARRLSEERELVLLRGEAGSNKLYRTSEMEKQLIDLTQALNHAALGDSEAALVEVRRIDERLRLLESERRPYWDRLAIARYVGGVLYEQLGELDSAFIDYHKAHGINRDLGAAGAPLVRLAREGDRQDEHRRMEASYPGVDARAVEAGEGEVVVLVAAGLSPERKLVEHTVGSGDSQITQGYMDMVPRPWLREPATVEAQGHEHVALTITSLEEIARQRGPRGHIEDTERTGTFMASWGHLLLFCLCWPVGIVTTSVHAANKGIMADQSWLSLPAEYQVARFRLPAGEHEILVRLGTEESRHRVLVPDRGVALISTRHFGAVETDN